MISKTNCKEVEVFYYFLDIAILQGNIEKAKMFLGFLRHEYEINPESFVELKADERFENLINLGKIVDEGKLTKPIDFETLKNERKTESDEKVVEKEKDLNRLICKNQHLLRDLISEDFIIENYEQKVMFGYVDLVGRDKDTVYVIELKKEVAKFDIVSQIDKYMYDFKVKLIYKLWKKVQGIVIANCFQDYALTELRKSGIICIVYSYENDVLKLRRI